MLGNVFSPFYARDRAAGRGDPLAHCTMNVALYGPRGKQWALTERGRSDVHRSADALTLGTSSLRWEGGALVADLNERCAPFPSLRPGRLRGRVRVIPEVSTESMVPIDGAGRHLWWPVAPVARVEVTLDEPSIRWTGHGYHDANAGDEPLESAFSRWDWSRASVDGDAVLLYDTVDRGGRRVERAMRCGAKGVEAVELPQRAALAHTGWRIDRATRADRGAAPSVARTLEDTPFYARSVVRTRLLGRDTYAMHERVDMDRFTARWVQFLLPFRMKRA
jgi:carotenoid 1,2-hydratase